MKQGSAQPILQLKNGGHADVRHALIECHRLDRLMRVYPQHFDVLLSLCRSEPAVPGRQNTSKNSVQFLKTHGSLLKDGTVRPLVRDVLLSGYQITPDGSVVTRPFAISSPEQEQIVETIQQEIYQNFADAVRRAASPDEPGRSSR